MSATYVREVQCSIWFSVKELASHALTCRRPRLDPGLKDPREEMAIHTRDCPLWRTPQDDEGHKRVRHDWVGMPRVSKYNPDIISSKIKSLLSICLFSVPACLVVSKNFCNPWAVACQVPPPCPYKSCPPWQESLQRLCYFLFRDFWPWRLNLHPPVFCCE